MVYVIKGIKIYSSNKEGEPLIDRKGRKYKRVFLTLGDGIINDTEWEGTASYLDYYDDSGDWREGTELDGEIKKNEVNGKVFWNFYKMRPVDALTDRIVSLEKRVDILEGKKTTTEEVTGGATEEVTGEATGGATGGATEEAGEDSDLPF